MTLYIAYLMLVFLVLTHTVQSRHADIILGFCHADVTTEVICEEVTTCQCRYVAVCFIIVRSDLFFIMWVLLY